MRYSYNLDRKEVIFASSSDLNASFKDLCAVCDFVRYRPLPAALQMLDAVIRDGRPIEYKRHNKYMGSRHELGGKKGRYPIKCAAMVRKVIVNVSANAKSKGEDPDSMFIVHASANKTQEVPRSPPKGTRAVRSGGYGYTPMRRSNLAFAKIEIGIADKDAKSLGTGMKRALKATSKNTKIIKTETQQARKAPAKVQPKPQQPAKPLPVTTAEKPGNTNAETNKAHSNVKPETKQEVVK